MFTRNPKAFLLLFGCLLQTYFSLGKRGRTKELILRGIKSDGSQKSTMKMNISQNRIQEKYAGKLFGRKNTAKMEIHRSVIGLHWNKIKHGRSHSGRLMEGIGRRQVGYRVSDCDKPR